MTFYHEANEPPYQTSLEQLSSDRHRPPQLNERNCACRCGCGCADICGGNDAEAEDEDALTLVASEHSEAEDEFPPSTEGTEEHHVNSDGFRPSITSEHGQHINGVFDYGADGFQLSRLNQHVIGLEEPPIRPQRMPTVNFPDCDDVVDSMKNEAHGSDDHSAVASDVVSMRGVSPGPGFAGIGDWAEEYHFSSRPLRLTPQHRYCRGLVASHLVLRDEKSFMDPNDDFLDD